MMTIDGYEIRFFSPDVDDRPNVYGFGLETPGQQFWLTPPYNGTPAQVFERRSDGAEPGPWYKVDRGESAFATGLYEKAESSG